ERLLRRLVQLVQREAGRGGRAPRDVPCLPRPEPRERSRGDEEGSAATSRPGRTIDGLCRFGWIGKTTGISAPPARAYARWSGAQQGAARPIAAWTCRAG